MIPTVYESRKSVRKVPSLLECTEKTPMSRGECIYGVGSQHRMPEHVSTLPTSVLVGLICEKLTLLSLNIGEDNRLVGPTSG